MIAGSVTWPHSTIPFTASFISRQKEKQRICHHSRLEVWLRAHTHREQPRCFMHMSLSSKKLANKAVLHRNWGSKEGYAMSLLEGLGNSRAGGSLVTWHRPLSNGLFTHSLSHTNSSLSLLFLFLFFFTLSCYRNRWTWPNTTNTFWCALGTGQLRDYASNTHDSYD